MKIVLVVEFEAPGELLVEESQEIVGRMGDYFDDHPEAKAHIAVNKPAAKILRILEEDQ